MWLITFDRNPDHLSEIVLIRLPYHEVNFFWFLMLCSFSPFFIMLCFSLNSPHLRSEELCFPLLLFFFFKQLYVTNAFCVGSVCQNAAYRNWVLSQDFLFSFIQLTLVASLPYFCNVSHKSCCFLLWLFSLLETPQSLRVAFYHFG